MAKLNVPYSLTVKLSVSQRKLIEKRSKIQQISLGEACRELIAAGIDATGIGDEYDV